MRKLEVHVFTERTSGSKTFRLSFWRILLVPVAILLAAVGFILFSPTQIIDLIGALYEPR